MRVLTNYAKEMKIAARGFYFYIEIFVAIIMLLILLFGVSEQPVNRQKEFLLYEDVSQEVYDSLLNGGIEQGRITEAEPVVFELKPISFTLTNRDTGEVTAYEFTEAKTVTLEAQQRLDPETGTPEGMIYLVENREDLYRLAFQERDIAAVISHGEDGRFYYEYINQGYETKRFIDALYIIHNESISTLENQINRQVVVELGEVQRLNNRENLVPAFLAFAGSLMGVFIVVAYVYLDKGEGVINALVVTPTSMMSYLVSKILVICTTILISSAIITIPVMGLRPSYLMLILFLLVTSFTFSALGLVIASLYDSLNKAFGILYGLMIALMVPGFSYYIPSFDPLWLRFFPTYPLLYGFKDLLLGNGQTGSIWMTIGGFLVAGLLLLFIADHRFRKNLRV